MINVETPGFSFKTRTRAAPGKAAHFRISASICSLVPGDCLRWKFSRMIS